MFGLDLLQEFWVKVQGAKTGQKLSKLRFKSLLNTIIVSFVWKWSKVTVTMIFHFPVEGLAKLRNEAFISEKYLNEDFPLNPGRRLVDVCLFPTCRCDPCESYRFHFILFRYSANFIYLTKRRKFG